MTHVSEQQFWWENIFQQNREKLPEGILRQSSRAPGGLPSQAESWHTPGGSPSPLDSAQLPHRSEVHGLSSLPGSACIPAPPPGLVSGSPLCPQLCVQGTTSFPGLAPGCLAPGITPTGLHSRHWPGSKPIGPVGELHGARSFCFAKFLQLSRVLSKKGVEKYHQNK